jgi:hypothetical protein
MVREKLDFLSALRCKHIGKHYSLGVAVDGHKREGLISAKNHIRKASLSGNRFYFEPTGLVRTFKDVPLALCLLTIY